MCPHSSLAPALRPRHPVAPDHRRAPQRRYNELATMTIKATGAVTSSVANTAKRVIVMVVVAIVFGEELTFEKKLGSFVAISGVFAYSIIDDLLKPTAKKA